jgi:hypothetical protein
LGILSDWDNPYLTKDFQYEANIVRALGQIVENGHVTKGYKPVLASILCPTLPFFFSTFNSIGNPWQSHPGTNGASKPDKDLDLIIISLSTLLTACPI